jgi:hypothetical protein
MENNGVRQRRHDSHRYTTEQIINKLRQAEVLLAQGRSIREEAKDLTISDRTCCPWHRVCGGIRTDQVKRLNARWKAAEFRNDEHLGHGVPGQP